MKTSHKLGIAFGLLIAIFAYGWGFYTHHRDEAAKKARETGIIEPAPAQPLPGEECWIVDETAREVANILLHAKGEAKPTQAVITTAIGVETELTASPTIYDVTIDSVPEKQRIQLRRYIWDEANYAPFAGGLMQAWKLEAPAPSKPDDSLLTTLLTPDPSVLVRESRRIARGLAEQPLDPELNEEAALLLGVFAMREASGSFYDTRATLCRMAAHLAVARASQPEAGPNGAMASAVLLALVGRETDSLAALAPLEKSQPAWVNALKLRNTNDWRILPDPRNATLLEQLEWFRAAVKTVDADFATRGLPRALGRDRTDWAHIVIDNGYFSVENGHRFARTSIIPEMEELRATWSAIFSTQMPQGDFAAQLNASPLPALPLKSDSTLEVLGWADWAAFYQRHICSDLQRTVSFMRDIWGVPESTTTFVTEMKKQFAGLTLYPFLATRCVEDKESYTAALLAAEEMCTRHPQLVTVDNWTWVKEPNAFRAEISRIPYVRSWVKVEYPFGTLYHFGPRYRYLAPLTHESTSWWNDLRSEAPYDFDLLQARLWNRHSATMAQIVENYSAIEDYDIHAMYQVAQSEENSPEAYIAAIQNICKLAPDYYTTLGDYLVAKNQPEEAAEAYRNGFEKATDRVLMSNDCKWIVQYDFTHDQKDEAERIAADAAEVYSYAGLDTMGGLREREGRLDDAEKYFAAMQERYDDKGPITAFYYRSREKSPHYAAASDAAMKILFPGGIEKVSPADFQNPPTDGVLVSSNSLLLQQFQLKAGDIFVAIEGCRVHNLAQFAFVRSGSDDPHFTLIVWSGEAYREVSVSTPQRRFNCNIGDYRKP